MTPNCTQHPACTGKSWGGGDADPQAIWETEEGTPNS